VDGIATFDNIYIDQEGEGYSIEFMISYPSTSILPVTSIDFDVSGRPLGLQVITNMDMVAENTVFKVKSKIWDLALDKAAQASVLSAYTWNCNAFLTDGVLSGTTSITVGPGENMVMFDDLKVVQSGLNHVVNVDCTTTDGGLTVTAMTDPFHVHVFPETGMLRQTITTFKFDGSLTKIEGIIKNFKNYMGKLTCKGCPNTRMDGGVDPADELNKCSSPLVDC
jgi:hypothetical protein